MVTQSHREGGIEFGEHKFFVEPSKKPVRTSGLRAQGERGGMKGALLPFWFSDTDRAIPSWRHAQEHFEREIKGGNWGFVEHFTDLTKTIAEVTSRGTPPYTPPHVTSSGKPPCIPPAVLTSPLIVSQIAPLMDQRVEICWVARKDMNGRFGVVIDFHPMGGLTDRPKYRYRVRLLDNGDPRGEMFMIKPQFVRSYEISKLSRRRWKAASMKAIAVDEHLQRECLEAVVFRKLLCLICLKPPRDEMRLPCDHSFCAGD